MWQGVTTAEIAALNLADLNLRAGTIYIAGSRSSNERTLELKPVQVLELMEYQMQTRPQLLQYHPAAKERLFLGITCWKHLRDDIRKQQPRFINFLQVRSSVITHWLKTHNLRKVQYMAGHRYVSSTEAYQVGNIEELQSDIGKFHPLG